MSAQNKPNIKIITKALIAISLLICWSLVLISGLLMWAAPHGQGMGNEPFLLGLTRHDIGDIHLTIALIAVVITIIHVIIDWKAFKGLLRYLTKVNSQASLHH